MITNKEIYSKLVALSEQQKVNLVGMLFGYIGSQLSFSQSEEILITFLDIIESGKIDTLEKAFKEILTTNKND